jgi:serine/threonine-protein kinase
MSRADDIEARLEAFDAAWQRGEVPKIETYLRAGSPAPEQVKLLHELIKIDLEYSWSRRNGTAPDRPLLENYVARFPVLGPVRGLPENLLCQEYLARLWAGDRPAPDDYARRFGRPADAMRQLLSAVDAEFAQEQERAARFQETQTESATIESPVRQSVDEFIATLRTHQIVAANEIQALEQERAADAPTLAESALKRGLLSTFQVNLLLKGRGGDLVLGPYLLQDRLGQGAMGRVYRAFHRKLGRVVAIKVIRSDLLKDWDEDNLSRFLQEVRAVGRVSHPNVVHAFDAGPIGATYFLAMEYIAGIDLYRRVKESGPLPPEQACDYVRQAALGLQHAHERGLVHRDIKPANLMIANGMVKILDLGLARLVLAEQVRSSSGLTRDGSMLGTIDYMAPEQADDPRHADIRADLYSLGCTFHYLLTGRPPFAEGTFFQKLTRHKNELAPTLPQVPANINAVIQRLLAKNPDERFQTPGELATVLGGGPRMRLPLKGGKRLRRRAALLLAAACVGLVLLLLPVYFLTRSAAEKDPAPAITKAPPAPTGRPVLHFDGESFVRLADGMIPATPPLAAEAWFRTEKGGVILGHQVVPYPRNVDEDHFNILYVGTDGVLRGGFWTGSLGIAGRGRVNDNRWHHAAIVFDGSVERLYQDGVEVASLPGQLARHGMIVTQIGLGCTRKWAGSPGDWYPFQGEIKEVRLWEKARTPAQLKQDMNQRVAGNEKGLMAYYPLDEASGEQVLDHSQRRRHGTLVWKSVRPTRIIEPK